MKAVFVLFLVLVPLLLIFILISYIRIYQRLKKEIKKHNKQEELKEIKEMLDKIYSDIPISEIKQEDNDNINNFHEVQYR